jgi:CRISPR/Cas system-associated endoribonuclease Cas2
MTWKKFFKPVNSVLPANQRTVDSTSAYASTSKYSNWLPEVYAGPPDRLQRYAVYDQMNYDHEISAALDTIADFGTEPDEVTKQPLVIKFNDEPTASEIQILEKSLGQWIRLNKLNKRIWRMFRSTLVYGDQFFLRDPETFKLYWIDPAKVEKVIVNESDGKKIESYFIKDIDLNMKELVATNQLNKLSNQVSGNSIVFSPPMQGNVNYVSGGFGGAGSANYSDGSATAVDAEHIFQLSLTDGMNAAWPFGLSILEQIYKVYKQKELLEDSILIYRVHRAPERRVFFIDVGTMPPNKAQQYLERIRYEVQQKRIPSRTGGGANITDSTYNPMSILEDYFFAVTSEGRGSKVEVLPGGENLGDIDDLRYFNNKMMRALGVPSSYLPTGPEDGTAVVTDGRVGTAFIQEFRFSKVVSRYQQQIVEPFDMEFKLFLKKRGVTIDNSLFELELTEPQSFSEYRQLELDSARINTFTALMDVSFISKRYILKHYLGWSEEQLAENERMWKEERSRLTKTFAPEPVGGAGGGAASGLSDVGITSSGIDNMGGEDDLGDEMGADGADDVATDAELDSFGEQ